MTTMPARRREEKVPLSGVQRAAILVMYLDRTVARALLDRLEDDDVQAVGLAMGTIQDVDSDVVEEVVAEFVRDLHEVSLMPRSGIEYVSDVLPDLLNDKRRDELLPVINRRVSRDFQQFISMRPPISVAAILRDEHPQTQAVALALMGPENAAKVMRFFADEDAAGITLRMARLKRIPGELADDVTSVIREALGRQDDHLELGGIDRTARILGHMRRRENGRILDDLSDENLDLADSLRRRMILFEDLTQLNNLAVQVVLKHVERDDLVLALKGAPPALVDLFLANVSSRAAEDIREEMELMGQVARPRTRGAQERIVAAAVRLAEEGSIFLPIGADDDDEEA